MVDVFRALDDETRRLVLDELAESDGKTLYEICSLLTMRHGLGLTRQAISQHLGVLESAGLVVTERRGRSKFHYFNPERLLAVIAQSPSLLGIGLDEDTSAVVYADRSMEVVGKGAVTVLDGSSIQTDAHQAKGHRPIMISGAVVHSLPDGSWFDLRARTLLAGAPGMEREASE